MLRMAVGHSDDVDPMDAIAAAIEQCRVTLDGARPQAGILFSSFDSFDPAIVTTVRDSFPGVSVMGCTSSAEVTSVNGYQEGSMALALFAADSVDISVGLGEGLRDDVDAACREAVGHALAATKREPKVCIVLVAGFVIDPQLAIDAVARALPAGVTILGGLSARGDLTSLTPTYQFCDGVVAEEGIALLLFSGPLVHSTTVGTGWKTIGRVGTVTDSAPGAINTVDGQPATDFVSRYLGATGPATFGNPFAVVEAGASESYLRGVQGSDPVTGSVSVTGLVPAGATIQLTTAGTEEILDGTHDALQRALAAYPSASPPEGALVFSCAVRKYLLGSRTQTEGELARSVVGPSVPLAGMYCFGEVGPIAGTATSRYFQDTFVTLLLGT